MTPPTAAPIVVDILVGAAVLLAAAAAPRRASLDPTDGEDVKEEDLLPVTDGETEIVEERDDVIEIVGLAELEGVTEIAEVTEIVGVTDAVGVTVAVGDTLAADGAFDGDPEGVPDDVIDIVGVFEGVAPNDKEPVGVGVCEIGVDVALSDIVGDTDRDSDIVGVIDLVGEIELVGVIEDVGLGAC